MGLFMLALFAIGLTVAVISWSNRKAKIGNIRCKRCSYLGSPKGVWAPFRGFRPVCPQCQSEDWVAVVAV